MLRGEYDWIGAGYKRPPMTRTGEYYIPVKELLRAGGWSVTSRKPRAYLRSKYFKERLAYHMQRLDGGFRKVLAEMTDNGKALEELSKALFASLMRDLGDPERSQRISFRDRAILFKEVTQLQAAIRGDATTRGLPRGPNVTNVLNIMAANMPDEEFKALEKKLGVALDRSKDIVEGVLEVADIEEE
jgi:hypothetical protein